MKRANATPNPATVTTPPPFASMLAAPPVLCATPALVELALVVELLAPLVEEAVADAALPVADATPLAALPVALVELEAALPVALAVELEAADLAALAVD